MRNHERYGIDPQRLGAALEKGVDVTEAPRFLVVDDHALVRHGLTLALKLRYPKATLFEAGSLAEALRRVRSISKLTAVLYDLQMADADGLPGVEAMLEALRGIPLLVISASLDAGIVAACIRAGARGFLPKGCDPDVLSHALPIVLGGGIYAPLPRTLATAASTAAGPPGQPPPQPPNGAMDALTHRQREVLRLLLQGQSNKEIARSLGVLEGTVKVHLRTVMLRLGVRNRTQLALIAARAGLSP
ncbi:response regulator transcription factor [Azospirillum sp. sgz301742]